MAIINMDNLTITLQNLQMTIAFGRALGHFALPGDVICLEGDLGAGKTTLTQAIALGLSVPESCYVTSPSFAIFHEYPGRIPMYHMDFYRLQDYTEVEDLGFEEYFYLSGLTVIEWPQRAGEILPKKRLHLELEIVDTVRRRLVCRYHSGTWAARIPQILTAAGLS